MKILGKWRKEFSPVNKLESKCIPCQCFHFIHPYFMMAIKPFLFLLENSGPYNLSAHAKFLKNVLTIIPNKYIGYMSICSNHVNKINVTYAPFDLK